MAWHRAWFSGPLRAPEYTGGMADDNDKRVRAWRIVGWVVALLAVVIVAGPQIIDLIGE